MTNENENENEPRTFAAELDRLGVVVRSVRINPDENGDRDTMRFRCTISRPYAVRAETRALQLETSYTAGSMVPDFSPETRRDKSVLAENVRKKIRRAWCPDRRDVVACLMLDAATADECRTFGEFACGYAGLHLADAAQIDAQLENWHTMQANSRKLRDLLGAAFDKVAEAARRWQDGEEAEAASAEGGAE